MLDARIVEFLASLLKTQKRFFFFFLYLNCFFFNQLIHKFTFVLMVTMVLELVDCVDSHDSKLNSSLKNCDFVVTLFSS